MWRKLAFLVIFAATPALADLSAGDWQKAAEKAEGAVRRGDDREAGAAILEVAKDDSERAAKLVCSVFSKFPGENESLYDKAYAAVEKLRAPKAVAELRKQLVSSKDWRLRVLLVDALGSRGKGEQEALIKALEDKQDEVIRAATRQLARLRTEPGIIAMCNAMEKLDAKGKTAATWQDLRNALMRALGVDFPGGADYRNYFEANKARFVEGQGIPPDPSKSKKGEGKVGETVVFGTELFCKNVVLILDRSGSMDITDPYPPGMDLGSKPRDYVESNGMLDPDRNRLKRARKELNKLLDGLAKAKGKVNIMIYSSHVECWKDHGLFELSSENLKSAKAYVDQIKAEGVTCTEQALLTAFEVAPNADCFYLISDGKANNGDVGPDGKQIYIPAGQIIGSVERMNKLRKVQINTFGFIPPNDNVEGADVELMSGLAEKTGGTYTEIR